MSLGLRSGSYGSLQQIQNAILPIQTTPPLSARKASKVLKDKEKLFHWIFKFAGRKKVGMLLLCAISAAVFMWVLYVGKGEVTQEGDRIESIRLNDSLNFSYLENSSVHGEQDDVKINAVQNVDGGGGSGSFALPPPLFSSSYGEQEDVKISASQYVNGGSGNFAPPPPLFSSAYGEQEYVKISASQYVNGGSESLDPPPPPPAYFTGYTLPPGNPCETFTLPPPPADKKRTGPRPCPVCYLPVEEAIALMPSVPSFSPVLKQLTYIHEEKLTKSEFGGSEFGGYPSLKQRNDSYDIREYMRVHCGFVRGNKPGRQTGFDIDDLDLLEMEQCRGVVVASAIFGAYDLVQQPNNISEAAKKNVCFFMFVDVETDAFIRNSGELDSSKRLGLWRVVVVYNLPYTDPRRNGKVPKLLLHRLFPNARYSLWIDGKLQLVVDPYQILERFLWRENASFAISRHYKRFDAFVEAEANKAAGKYDNASIDFQIDFYKNEGLTPYSEAKLPITSDVPEGCVIVREHIPISNLFGCLWFHEVDRFTSRDQISFSIVRDKIMSKTNWSVNMFLDCERRNFVVQGYHRDVLENWAPPPPPLGAIAVAPPPPFLHETPNITLPHILTQSFISIPTRKVPGKRGSRRSSSRRHRKVASGSKDINSS